MITREEVIRTALKQPHELAPTSLQIGDIVTFTNDYGVVFTGLEVVGFDDPTENNGRSVFLASDSYWFPKAVNQLTLELKA